MCGGTRERGVAGGMKQETNVVLSTDEHYCFLCKSILKKGVNKETMMTKYWTLYLQPSHTPLILDEPNTDQVIRAILISICRPQQKRRA